MNLIFFYRNKIPIVLTDKKKELFQILYENITFMKMLIVTLIYSLLLIGLNSYQIHAKLDPMEVHFWLYTNDNLELDQYENMIFDGEKVTLDPNTKFDPSRATKLVGKAKNS